MSMVVAVVAVAVTMLVLWLLQLLLLLLLLLDLSKVKVLPPSLQLGRANTSIVKAMVNPFCPIPLLLPDTISFTTNPSLSGRMGVLGIYDGHVYCDWPI
jgi:hypothetical protein